MEEVTAETYAISEIVRESYDKFQGFGDEDKDSIYLKGLKFYGAYDFALMKGELQEFLERVEKLRKEK